MFLDKQDSMPRVLNMPKFWIWQNSEYDRVLNLWVLHSLLNMPEYVLAESFEYILGSKYARIRNMAGFWICKSYTGFYTAIWLTMSERTWICLNMSEFTIIDRPLNMYHTIHSGEVTLQVIMSAYWEMGGFRPLSEIYFSGKTFLDPPLNVIQKFLE